MYIVHIHVHVHVYMYIVQIHVQCTCSSVHVVVLTVVHCYTCEFNTTVVRQSLLYCTILTIQLLTRVPCKVMAVTVSRLLIVKLYLSFPYLNLLSFYMYFLSHSLSATSPYLTHYPSISPYLTHYPLPLLISLIILLSLHISLIIHLHILFISLIILLPFLHNPYYGREVER